MQGSLFAGCPVFIAMYSKGAASGRSCRYQSMQEKLPVAGSVDTK